MATFPLITSYPPHSLTNKQSKGDTPCNICIVFILVLLCTTILLRLVTMYSHSSNIDYVNVYYPNNVSCFLLNEIRDINHHIKWIPYNVTNDNFGELFINKHVVLIEWFTFGLVMSLVVFNILIYCSCYKCRTRRTR